MMPHSFPHDSFDPILNTLEPLDRARLETRRAANPFTTEVLIQLARILSSPQFARLHQMARNFLSFVVCKTLLGDQDQLKETTIAVFVFKERADFDPAESNRIRFAAWSLRLRLTAHYATDGRRDPIRIALPSWGYIPHIRDRRSEVGMPEFCNWSPSGNQQQLCRWVTEQVANRLNQVGWIRVLQAPTTGGAALAPRFCLHGSVEPQADSVKLNVSLGETATHRILFSHNVEDKLDRVFGLAHQLAERLIDVMQLEVDGPAAVSPAPRPKPARVSSRRRTRVRKRIS